MIPEQLDFARRLATDSRFNKWTGGLRIVYGQDPHEQFRVDGDGEDAVIISAEGDVWSQQDPEAIPWQFTLGVPDLTDAATGGVLLDMLDYTGTGWLVAISVKQGVRRWAVYERGDAEPGMGWCPFLAEACARALLAEWGSTASTPETTAS